MFVFCIPSVHLFTESFVSCLFYLIIRRFGDKATTSASPSRELDFQDGVALLFQVLFHGSALFAISICNSGSISSFLIFSLPADHS